MIEIVRALLVVLIALLAPPPVVEEPLVWPTPDIQVVESTPIATAFPLGSCAVLAGERLTLGEITALVAPYDWTPWSSHETALVFQAESGGFVGAENICTNDYGLPQINKVHAGKCDLGRVLVDAPYAVSCAHLVYAERLAIGGPDFAVGAWYAAEGGARMTTGVPRWFRAYGATLLHGRRDCFALRASTSIRVYRPGERLSHQIERTCRICGGGITIDATKRLAPFLAGSSMLIDLDGAEA